MYIINFIFSIISFFIGVCLFNYIEFILSMGMTDNVLDIIVLISLILFVAILGFYLGYLISSSVIKMIFITKKGDEFIDNLGSIRNNFQNLFSSFSTIITNPPQKQSNVEIEKLDDISDNSIVLRSKKKRY